MKITDLMHGDWFNSKKGTCRINEIRLFTAIVEYSDEAYQDNGNVSSEEIDFEYDIEPLPISEEIIKANGFKTYRDPSGVEFKLFVGTQTSVKLNPLDESRWSFVVVKKDPAPFSVATESVSVITRHVHQMQHALRLMGLVELADKFTLTEKQPFNQ